MLVFAVVSAETEHGVELFIRREDAEAFVDDVRADDTELAETRRLEGVELDARDWRYQGPYAARSLLDRLPNYLLRAEGVAGVLAAVIAYFYADYPWWLFLVLALAPDISMVGFAASPRVGTATYNAAHTYAVPVLLGALGLVAEGDLAVQIALIWVAHIAVDRNHRVWPEVPEAFKDTHLQRV